MDLKVDYALTAVFTLEMLLQVIHHGGLRAYAADGWNVLDGVIVLTALASLPFSMQQEGASGAGGALAATKGLRTVRVLRPLRAIERFPSLKGTVHTIISTLPVISGVFALLLFIWFLFAVIGNCCWPGYYVVRWRTVC